MKFLHIFGGLFCIFALNSHAASIQEDTLSLPTGTNLALLVQKIGTNLPVVNYNGQQMGLPASTQKLITALAAMLQLGPDYHFITTFETHGKIVGNQLKGDLTVRFTGDPTLTRQNIRNMVTELKKQGVQKIDGDVLIDTSAFASHDKAPGWPWNDITQCFSAPSSAAIIDRNCFSIALYSGKSAGDNAFIRVASYYPVHMFSEVRTLARNSTEAPYCELDIVAGELNRFTLTGCMPQRAEPLPLAFAIQDGASYSGAIVKNTLLADNIEISGRLHRQTQPNSAGIVLSQTQSPPLSTLLRIMLKKSDNMIADTVFRTIGHNYFNVPGTWRAGSNAVRKILRQKAGIDLSNSVVVDGSGLSRHNLMSPVIMMQVLQYIAQHDNQLKIIEKLPLAGHDGTLQYRPGLDIAGVNGKVSAKTGSLQGVYNLAGFITAASGQRFAFVQYLSNYAVPPQEEKARRQPLARFEGKLYRDIYQNH